MNPLFELKEHQKMLAALIRRESSDSYTAFHNRFKKDQFPHSSLFYPGSYDFRHYHIAYCELRGRTREQIEIPAEGNNPNEKFIEKIKAIWQEKIDEALRARAERSNS